MAQVLAEKMASQSRPVRETTSGHINKRGGLGRFSKIITSEAWFLSNFGLEASYLMRNSYYVTLTCKTTDLQLQSAQEHLNFLSPSHIL
jgi:hypothetical protein